MKMIIDISNYVDTSEVIVDGSKIDINKLSLLSKAEFISDVKPGICEIYIVKKSEISERNWKKGVLFDWVSCLFGVPSWTLAEKVVDIKTYSMMLKVQVIHDIQIKLKLTENGFELIENLKDILDKINKTETTKAAQNRIKHAYIIPLITIALVIEICLLIGGGFFIVNGRYDISFVFLVISVFWIWLICSLIFQKRKK